MPAFFCQFIKQKTNDKHDRNQNFPFSWGLLNVIYTANLTTTISRAKQKKLREILQRCSLETHPPVPHRSEILYAHRAARREPIVILQVEQAEREAVASLRT